MSYSDLFFPAMHYTGEISGSFSKEISSRMHVFLLMSNFSYYFGTRYCRLNTIVQARTSTQAQVFAEMRRSPDVRWIKIFYLVESTVMVISSTTFVSLQQSTHTAFNTKWCYWSCTSIIWQESRLLLHDWMLTKFMLPWPHDWTARLTL